ncbi:MAG: hypothetical protein ACK5ZC_07970 [Pirellulaceae bacterium]|jgi:hypothetical protein
MLDYQLQRCTRRCAVSGQPLAPGAPYYSAVLQQGDQLVRIDVGPTHWQGPPERAIGWWQCEMPKTIATRREPTPNSVLLDRLEELLESPEQSALASLLALLLWRRRVLQMEPSAASDPDATMHLHCPADGRSFVVAAPPESNDAIEALQEGLQSMLFRDVTAMSDASSSSPGDPEQGSIR